MEALQARARHHARPGRGAGRRRPGEPGLCAHQGQGRRARRAWRPSSTSSTRRPPRARCCALIAELNRRPDVHGILVQLPLPAHIDTAKVIEAIDPAKDVDGFHPINVGRLAIGEPALAPCTPTGCLILAKSVRAEARGARGRGDRPLQHRRQADGAAAAQRELHRDDRAFAHARSAGCRAPRRSGGRGCRPGGDGAGHWIKPGAIVIDVGIQRVTGSDGKSRLVGDVAFDEAAAVARRHHAGARRRRPDDGRLPAQEHARRRRRQLSPEALNALSGPGNVSRETSMCWLICFT